MTKIYPLNSYRHYEEVMNEEFDWNKWNNITTEKEVTREHRPSAPGRDCTIVRAGTKIELVFICCAHRVIFFISYKKELAFVCTYYPYGSAL